MTTSQETAGTTRVAAVHAQPDKLFDRVSWGSIFAGAATALATQLVLSLIGLGIGLSTLDPQTGDSPSGAAIGIGAVVWWTVSSLASLYLGGFVAGRIAGSFNGYLHGLVTWATVSLLTVMLLSGAAGRAFSGATGLAQFAAQSAPAAQQQAPNLVANLQSQVQNATNQAQGTANDPNARAQAEQQAREVGDKAAKGGAMGSLGGALALILGALAAGMGGSNGRKSFLTSNHGDGSLPSHSH